MSRFIVCAPAHIHHLQYYGDSAAVERLGIVHAEATGDTVAIIHVVGDLLSFGSALMRLPGDTHPGLMDDPRVVVLFSEEMPHFLCGIDAIAGRFMQKYPGRLFSTAEDLLQALEAGTTPPAQPAETT